MKTIKILSFVVLLSLGSSACGMQHAMKFLKPQAFRQLHLLKDKFQKVDIGVKVNVVMCAATAAYYIGMFKYVDYNPEPFIKVIEDKD
jgi:hypothetical protein